MWCGRDGDIQSPAWVQRTQASTAVPQGVSSLFTRSILHVYVEPFVCSCSQSISFSLALASRLDVRGLDEGCVYYVSYSSPFPSIMEFAVVYIFECCSELIRKYSQAGGNGKDNSVIVKRDILQRESGFEGV